MKKTLSILAVTALTLSACNNPNGGGFQIGKKEIGSIAGAAAGAWAGSNVGKGSGRTAAIAAGTLLGAFVGSEIGDSLDKADLAYNRKASQEALEYGKTGTTVSWENPDNNHSGSITPVKTYRTDTGNYCREYSQTISVGGKSEKAYGTACRQPDGTWEIQS